MKIIFLSGKKQCGKTPTLTMVYDSLTNGMKPKLKKTFLIKMIFIVFLPTKIKKSLFILQAILYL